MAAGKGLEGKPSELNLEELEELDSLLGELARSMTEVWPIMWLQITLLPEEDREEE